MAGFDWCPRGVAGSGHRLTEFTLPRDTATLSNSPGAIRQRRHRALKKHGRCCVTLELSGEDLDALNDAGLCAWNELRRDVLAEAARRAFDQWKRQLPSSPADGADT
jgi:hypothetical protein